MSCFQYRQFSRIFISVLRLPWSLRLRRSNTGFPASYSDRRIEQTGLKVALHSCIREMHHSNIDHHTWYPDWGFRSFRQSLETNFGFVPVLGHDHLLPYPSEFITYLSVYHVTLCSPDIGNMLLKNPGKLRRSLASGNSTRNLCLQLDNTELGKRGSYSRNSHLLPPYYYTQEYIFPNFIHITLYM
jgi:hypothetical protein